MSFSVPEPESLRGISAFYSANSLLGSSKEWLADSTYVEPLINQMLDHQKQIVAGGQEYDQITLHLLFRAMHQVNEACNKLWGTIELHHHLLSCGPLCKEFSLGFLGSTAVPTLHYANVASLISILSLYGLGSLVRKESKMVFYNIVRTKSNIQVSKRNLYLMWLLGSVPNGWHNQILSTYEGLQSKGLELPKVDLDASRALLKRRTEYHYDVLSHTTMYGVYGVGAYFRYLSTALDSTYAAINSIKQVVGSISNGCDVRFDEIAKKAPQLAEGYGHRIATHLLPL